MATSVEHFNITAVDRYKLSNMNMNLVQLFFIEAGDDDFKYETGGIEVTPEQMGVKVVEGLSGFTSLGHYMVYDPDNDKIKFYASGGTEVANDNEDLQGETAIVTVIGR